MEFLINSIGVKVIPRTFNAPEDPDAQEVDWNALDLTLFGHMGLYWKIGDEVHFRGFYPDASAIRGRLTVGQLRERLFNEKIPGIIIEDTLLSDAVREMPEDFLCRSGTPKIDITRWFRDTHIGPNGYYSFNPDTKKCDNCVTWATRIVKRHSQIKLRKVREGRIKEIVKQLTVECDD